MVYKTINDRIENIENWKLVCKKLTADESPITLNSDLHIENDVSDFIEKIRIADGEMTILKALKGTFGFPFETILDGYKWFTKMMIYDFEIDESILPKKHYDNLTESERSDFHKLVISQKNISINTEHTINTILTDLFLKKITPHICVIYGATELMEPKHSELIKMFVKRYKYKDRECLMDLCKVLMTEWADLGELSDYIESNKNVWTIETWRALFFQMLAMLALIQEHYPTFRHNDLSMSNILVQTTRKTDIGVAHSSSTKGYYKYTINGKVYCIPDVGFRVLLADFDYASIKEMGITNEKLDNRYTKRFGAVSEPNRSFDTHMMLNWINMWTLRLYRYDELAGPLGQVKEFLYGIIEEKFRGNKSRYVNHTRLRNGNRIVEELIPVNILEKDVFFEKYRNYEELIKDMELIEIYNNTF
jgi:hypothetical protein